MREEVPAPGEALDWAGLRARHDWVERLHSCPQDPRWHAEGDVGIHTEMVLEALMASAEWAALPEEERAEVWLAALLHDVAKPDCTRTGPDGRITSRGHSRRGAKMARHLLYRAGVDPRLRERICALIAHHQVPFFLIDRDDPRPLGIRVSTRVASCRRLAMLTEADGRGRRCEDQQRILDRVQLFRLWCEEQGCLEEPWAFRTRHARFLWFRDPERSPLAPGFEDFRCEVVLMSGLPGSGKDTWLRDQLPGWPVVSLDAVRREMGVSPADHQGRVVEAARERAKVLLREGRSFAWNATNVSRDHRRRCVDLFARYGARVRVVYVEAPWEELLRRNREREHPVPEAVLERLARWMEPPDRSEAHELVWV